MPPTPQYPLAAGLTDTVHIFNPDLQVPVRADLGRRHPPEDRRRTSALEVRYVGTRHLQGWGTVQLSTRATSSTNGFINEFRQAQANLQANIAAGRGNTFAYTGAPGTGSAADLSSPTSTARRRAGRRHAKYTGANWTNTNFTNPLAVDNPNPFTPAGTNATTGLDGDAARRANALAAGLPREPLPRQPGHRGGADRGATRGYQRYNSVQFDVSKRLSHGFLMQGSYVFGKAYTSSRYSLKAPRKETLQTGAGGDPAASRTR